MYDYLINPISIIKIKMSNKIQAIAFLSCPIGKNTAGEILKN